MVVSCQAGLPQGMALNSDCVRVLSRFSFGGICLVFNLFEVSGVLVVFFFCFHSTVKLMEFLSNQVYVRRAYIAYELNNVQHRQLKDNTCVVEFQFMLPTSHPNRSDRVLRCLWDQRFLRGCIQPWQRKLAIELVEKGKVPVPQISTNYLR